VLLATCGSVVCHVGLKGEKKSPWGTYIENGRRWGFAGWGRSQRVEVVMRPMSTGQLSVHCPRAPVAGIGGSNDKGRLSLTAYARTACRLLARPVELLMARAAAHGLVDSFPRPCVAGLGIGHGSGHNRPPVIQGNGVGQCRQKRPLRLPPRPPRSASVAESESSVAAACRVNHARYSTLIRPSSRRLNGKPNNGP
jgi:hypothetical protein